MVVTPRHLVIILNKKNKLKWQVELIGEIKCLGYSLLLDPETDAQECR